MPFTFLDCGRRKALYNTVKAIEKLTQFNNDLDEVTWNRELLSL